MFCPWDPPKFLIFSENVPQIFYYSHGIVLITALILGLFVFLKNRSLLSAKLLLAINFLFCFWVFLDLAIWATNDPSFVMFWWSAIILVETLIYALSLYLAYAFISGKDASLKQKAIVGLLLLPIIILLPTAYNLSGIELETCLAIESFIPTYYTYIFELLMSVGILIFSFGTLRKTTEKNKRKEIMLFMFGIVLFLIAFSYGNVIGSITDDWEIAQYGLFGMPIFVGFLAYMIVKFKTFHVKVIATQALVWALWIMIGSILLVAQTDATRIVTAITEIIAIIFGIMLIRSVKREVEQREKLEVLSNELKAANDRLEILDEQKTQFVSFASHDLKSPINIIKQFATLIADGTYKEPAKVQETVVKIKSTADRATQMVDDFLDIRKIEEGKMDYNFETKDIVSFVKGITEDYAPVAKAQKNIAVSFMTTTPEIKVKMDSTRLRQVIQNYLNNSVKYTDPVKSDDHGARANWIKVMVTDEQSTVLISIKDSGMGLSAELIPTLFEQFHRDKNTAKKIQGTGLGLYISKQIVLGHAGETWAQSDGQGKGSTFFVRLKKA